MQTLKLTICLLAVVAVSAMAQTYPQKGVVRMITSSASSPLTPVAGVRVQVGNNISKATDRNGAFTIQVAKKFQVNGVKPSDQYLLALPTRGKAYNQSANDLDVVVTTLAKKEIDYKKLYRQLKQKYDSQTDSLTALKRKYQRLLNEMNENDAEYSKTKAEFDRVQALYLDCLNNEEKLDEEIKRIAEELAITDYISLDSIERRIYNLKSLGEWKSITDLTNEVMRGDAAAFLQEGIDLEKQKEEELAKVRQELKQAQLDKASRFKIIEETIESFKMQHLNDSVSMYYRILTDAAPDNWDYLNSAGVFETQYMANYSKAMNYYQQAVATNPADTLLATSYNNIGYVYDSLSDYSKALEYYETALKIWLAVFGENHPYVATCYNNIGLVYDSLSDHDKALEYYEKALKIRLAVFGENHPDVATSYNNIGYLYKTLGDYDKALEYYDKAMKIRLAVFGENHPDVATSYNNIGLVYESQGEYNKALEYYDKAMKIRLAVFGENHPDVATSYNNIGSAYDSLGDYSKALEYYEKALKIDLAVFGENHPNVATSYNNIGLVYSSQGDYAKALEYFEKALKIGLAIFGESHPDVAQSYNNIGLAYHYQFDYDKALEHYEKALKIQLSVFGENHPDVALIYNNMGNIYSSQSKYVQALEHLEKALNIRIAVFGENNRNVALNYNNIGNVYDSKGDYDKALEYYEKALKIWLATFGERHPDVATIYNNIGSVYFSQGDYDKALEYHEKALYIRLAVFGENNTYTKTTQENILYCSYFLAIKDYDIQRLGKIIVTGTIDEGGVAAQRGMSGEYYIIEFGNWTIETNDKNIYDINESLRGKPKDVMFYRDGEITKEHFNDIIGMRLGLSEIVPADKSKIIEEYRKWKESSDKQQ